MQKSFYQRADAGVSLSDSVQETLYQTADAEDRETLYQTADAGDTYRDAGVSLSDSGCRRHSIRQRMQETLYQTAYAEVSLSAAGVSILYHRADAEVFLLDS